MAMPSKDIGNVLNFMEDYDATNNTMDKTTFDEFSQILVHYMDIQAEVDEIKEKHKSFADKVESILEEPMDEADKLHSLTVIVAEKNGKTIPSRHKSSIHSGGSRTQEMEDQISTLKGFNAELKDELDRANSRLQELEELYDKSEMFSKSLAGELSELKEESADTAMKLRTKEDELDTLQRNYDDLLDELKSKSAHLRLQVEKEENAKIKKELETKKAEYQELETKLQSMTMELSKKSQKVTQVSTSMYVLQSQVDRMRVEIEEERSSAAKEVNNLNSIIAEKNSEIERLKSDGGFERDRIEDGEDLEALAMGANAFETIFREELADMPYDQPPVMPSMNPKSGQLSPRSEMLKMRKSFGNSAMFAKMSNNGEEPQEQKESEKPRKLERANSKVLDKQPAKTGDLNLPVPPELNMSVSSQSNKMSELVERVSNLTSQVKKLETELAEATKMTEVYKKNMQDRDKQINRLHEKLMNISMENSQTINDINAEYDKAMALLKQYRKQK